MRLEYFEMIDRVTAVDADRLVAECRVPSAEGNPVFAGHLPGYPLMPGVLLIETMAQTSGWLIIGLTKFTRMPFFAAVKEAKLRSFVTPGQKLSVTASIVHEGSGFAMTKAEIRHDGKLACSAELTFRVVEFPNPDFRANMEKLAAEIAFPMEALTHA
jgi:3-hydroxyacyl-[acyl-carrier-protein] dehydratase